MAGDDFADGGGGFGFGAADGGRSGFDKGFEGGNGALAHAEHGSVVGVAFLEFFGESQIIAVAAGVGFAQDGAQAGGSQRRADRRGRSQGIGLGEQGRALRAPRRGLHALSLAAAGGGEKSEGVRCRAVRRGRG